MLTIMTSQGQAADTVEALLAAEKKDRQCNFTEAFTVIETQLRPYQPDIQVVAHSGPSLTVSLLNGKNIKFDCTDVPCFNVSIPEMLTTYIMAQLLKIAEAVENVKSDDNKGVDNVMDSADTNFKSKVAILHEIDAQFSNRVV